MADTPGNSFMSTSKQMTLLKKLHAHLAISTFMEGWAFSFWPEAKEQLIHDLFYGDSHSGLTQVTSQKDLVPVLTSVPGTVQTPSVKREAGAEFGMSHTLLQPGFMSPP